MPQAQQQVGNGAWQIAPLAQAADAHRAIALGQGCVGRSDEQWQVPVFRWREAERLDQRPLPWRVRHVVFAAQHQGNAHIGVINRIGRQERRRPVRPTDHEIP